MKNDIKKDIFDILGINGREDSYTDLLYSIFEVSDEFKNNILKEFFNDNGDIQKLEMKIRSCYFTPKGKRKKIIPDIILCNENKMVIIEVKIFSGEGEDQLKSYADGIEEIKSKINLNNANEVEKYFLTLDEHDNDQLDGAFKSITWKKIIDLIPEKTNNDIINLCIDSLKERVNDYDRYSNNVVNIEGNSNFKEIYKWNHFISYEKILKQVFNEDIIEKQYKWSIWEGWENGENCYAASIQIYCDDSWKTENEIKTSDVDGETIVTNKNFISAKNNYDIHFEIKIIGDYRIDFRIDYHTNPYLTNNDIKYYGLYSLHDERKGIIQTFNKKYKEEADKLNKAQGKALYVYKESVIIEANWTVNDFKKTIFDLINKNINKIQGLLDIINNYK